MAVLDKLKSSDHRLVIFKVTLDLRREREKIYRIKKANIFTVKEKSDEFAIRIQNKYSQLADEMNRNKELK